MNAGDQWNRQQLHEAQKLNAAQPDFLGTRVNAARRDALIEDVEICSGREMPQSTTDDDGTTAGLLRRLDLFDDRIDQPGPEQIVRPVNHRQD